MLSRSLPALVKSQFNVVQRLRTTRDVQPIHTQVSALLAGHSKWSNIRHVKALKDGQRAALFVRLARQIRLAVQEGGSPDPAYNSHLKGVVEQALRQRMPMASIQNNLKRSKEQKGDLKEYIFQARYLQKVFMVIVTYSDNITEVKKELIPAIRRSGGTVLDDNYLFEDLGLVEATLDKDALRGDTLEDRATTDAIECGIEDVEIVSPDKGTVNFTCNPGQLMSVRKNLEGRGYKVDNAEHVFLPKNVVQITAEELKSYNTALQKLRNVGPVENIYDNIDRAVA